MNPFKRRNQTPKSGDTSNSSNTKIVNSNNSNGITGNDNTIVEGDQKVSIKAGRDINLHVYAGSPPTGRGYSAISVVDMERMMSQGLEPSTTNIEGTSAGDGSNEHDSRPIPTSHVPTESARSSVRWESDSETDTGATPFTHEGLARSTIAGSVASRSRNIEAVLVTTGDIENHLPDAAAYIKCYMSMALFDDNKIIPLWEPSPPLNDIHSHPRTWRTYVTIGDVGLFNAAGGFDTFFNIFLTFEENRARGYNPPPNFLRYCTLPEIKLPMHDLERNEKRPKIKRKGFVICGDGSKSPDNWIVLKRPEDKKGICSALNMAHGYKRIMLDQFEVEGIKKWVMANQDDWHRHLDFATHNGQRKRFLLVITACYRAKSWASASVTRASKSSKIEPLLLEKDSGNDINKGYTWFTEDEDIVTNCGPSSSQTEAMMLYFEDLDKGVEPCDSRTRKETEECNCIAVQAFFVQKKFLGIPLGSRRSTRSSVLSGNRSIFSRFTQLTVTKASPSEQKTVKAALKGVFSRSNLGQ